MEGGMQVLSNYMMVDAKAGISGRHQLNGNVFSTMIVPADEYLVERLSPLPGDAWRHAVNTALVNLLSSI
jgi:hypothetical protein